MDAKDQSVAGYVQRLRNAAFGGLQADIFEVPDWMCPAASHQLHHLTVHRLPDGFDISLSTLQFLLQAVDGDESLQGIHDQAEKFDPRTEQARLLSLHSCKHAFASVAPLLLHATT